MYCLCLQLPGNKMDSHNLATLFGPNILHKAKPTEKEFAVESMERAEERKDVIEVIKAMIDHHQTVFQVTHLHHLHFVMIANEYIIL